MLHIFTYIGTGTYLGGGNNKNLRLSHPWVKKLHIKCLSTVMLLLIKVHISVRVTFLFITSHTSFFSVESLYTSLLGQGTDLEREVLKKYAP